MRWLKIIFYLFVPLTMVMGASFLLQEVINNDAVRTDPGFKQAQWPALPATIIPGNPTGLGIDTNQNIVVFHRAGKEWPLLGSISKDIIKDNTILIIHNKTGELLSSRGGEIFVMPHGLTTDNENNIWVKNIAGQTSMCQTPSASQSTDSEEAAGSRSRLAGFTTLSSTKNKTFL
ncbi:hypothetical protein [Pseudoflavitalea rhizosphaerae]|uniref:hypothetical protein n=1 Tax=Pseudoflavitalea rhizosphaerae TaxID=1884793 RepID=UPI000F8F2AD9|nr:hypothetical protein [Pseudoflavitalea rhizosphaerae]